MTDDAPPANWHMDEAEALLRKLNEETLPTSHAEVLALVAVAHAALGIAALIESMLP
jgi:hypothetical protein